MHALARLVPLGLLTVVLSVPTVVPPAQAATADVSISGFAFRSSSITVAQGTTVRWTNNDGATHSSQSNGGFWSSPNLPGAATYSQTTAFKSAGAYGYHCRQHSHMTGIVRVPMKKSGSSGAGWTIRWSSLTSTPTSRRFDVQILRPGSSTWQAWRTDTSARAAFFNPTRTGTYRFRARTDNRSNGRTSAFSPVLSAAIT